MIGLVLGTTALLLSDRAPGLYEDGFARLMRVLAHVRNAVGLDDDDIGRQDIPVGDQTLGHAVLFFGVTVAAAFVLRRRVRPWIVALVVFGASALFEVLQPLLSVARTEQSQDFVANAIGALVGWVVVTLLLRIPRLRRSRSLAW